MKRSITPEQKARRDERKAQFKALWKRVADMPEAERLALSAKVGIVTPDGHALSAHNQCLVAFQCSTATVVGGFRQWLKNGRQVRKGEHGAMIWVPIRVKSSDPSAPSEDGELREPAVSAATKFIIGTVFDISQTMEKPAETPVTSAGAVDLDAVVFEPVPQPAQALAPPAIIPLPVRRPSWRRAA
jgi:hypothetical protein